MTWEDPSTYIGYEAVAEEKSDYRIQGDIFTECKGMKENPICLSKCCFYEENTIYQKKGSCRFLRFNFMCDKLVKEG